MPRMMFIECTKCGTKFDWEVSQQDPICQRCFTITGSDPKKILALMEEQKIPGQKEMIHVLKLIIDRLEKLEPLKR